MAESQTLQGWGPQQRRAAVSVTFDNLGEAADIEFGQWPTDAPVGQHFTATEVVPQLLGHLQGMQATFYIEAWNVDLYPGLLKAVRGQGHEIGVHGWRHELWDRQPETQRAELFERCFLQYGKIGIRPVGFRPPGGQSTADLPDLLRKYGYSYHSSVGTAPQIVEGIVSLPFQWDCIDGYHLEPAMQGVAKVGEAPEQANIRFRQAIDRRIADTVEARSHLMLIFHPWVIGKTKERMELVRNLVSDLVTRQDIWVAPGEAVAGFLKSSATHP